MIKNIKNKTTCVNNITFIHHVAVLLKLARGYTCESELDELFDMVASTDA